MASSVIGSLRVNLGIDSAQFSEGLQKAQKSLSGFGKSMQRIGAGLTAAVTLPLAALGKGMIDAASNAAETASAFDHLFKDQAGDVRKWADETAKALGRSTFALQEQALAFQQYFSQVAPTNEQAAEMSKQFTQLSQDLASFYNVTESDALQKLRSGLAGEAEPLRAFGVFLSAAAVEAKALELGLTGVGNELTEQEKVLARAAVIMEQTTAAQGDAARTAQSFSNQSKALSAALSDIGIQLGTILLPVALKVTSALGALSRWFATLSPETQEWVVILGGAAAVLGPVVAALGLFVAGIAAIGIPVAAAIAGIAALTAAIVAFWPEITNLATAITAFLSGAWAAFEAAWDGMVAKVAEVKASIVEFAASIPQIFANLASQMVTIGGQIIQGLWDGLKSKMTAVKDYLVGSVSGMVDSVKSTLGIQSPSKVMHEVGTNVMQGLSDGMTDMQGGLENTASSIASTISSAFKGVIDGSKTVKEAIQDVLKSLGQMLIDQGFRALTSGLFGGGGGGGFLGGLLGGLGGLFGFAQGGSFQVGGAGGIDSQLVAFKASPNERVTVTKPGQEDGRHGSGGMQVYVAPSPYFDVRVEEISQRTAAPMVRAGMQQANNAVVPTVARYQNDIAGSDYRVA